jgi:hypothetical protein
MPFVHEHTVYITYELPTGAREVKRFAFHGELVRSETGEFKTPSGGSTGGVRLTLSVEDEEDLERRLIELPVGARNARTYLDVLPEDYRSAPQSAA